MKRGLRCKQSKAYSPFSFLQDIYLSFVESSHLQHSITTGIHLRSYLDKNSYHLSSSSYIRNSNMNPYLHLHPTYVQGMCVIRRDKRGNLKSRATSPSFSVCVCSS